MVDHIDLSSCCCCPLIIDNILYTFYFCRYDLCAIQKEKLRRMETENGKSKDVITVEVEMQESKGKGSTGSQTLEIVLESEDP